MMEPAQCVVSVSIASFLGLVPSELKGYFVVPRRDIFFDVMRPDRYLLFYSVHIRDDVKIRWLSVVSGG